MSIHQGLIGKSNLPHVSQLSADVVLELVSGRPALEQLSAGWRCLQNQLSAPPMSRFEWTFAYLESFAQASPERVLLATIKVRGEIDALIPLVQKGVRGFRFFELLGAEIYEPTAVLYRNPEHLVRLLDGILTVTGQPLVFERYPNNVASLQLITSSLSGAWRLRRRPRPSSPSVSIGTDPEQVLNSGRRSDLRRMMRRAEKHGAVTHRILSPEPDEVSGLLEMVMRIESAGWKGKRKTSLRDEAVPRRFFERFATLAAEAGSLRIAFLDIDGESVATQLAVETGDSLWLFKIGYNEAYSDCSPGNLLMMEVIRYASQRKLKTCEFLGRAEAWTRMWTNSEYGTECITLFPSRTSYYAHMFSRAAQQFASKFWQKSYDKFK